MPPSLRTGAGLPGEQEEPPGDPQAAQGAGAGHRPEFVRGEGAYLVRSDGARYIDAASGTFNLSLGYDHAEVVDAVVEQVRRYAHISSTTGAERPRNVLRQLLAVAPENIGAGRIRDITGSTANECALKIAQKATGKTDILSLFLSHHGQTELTTAISGNAFRRRGFPDSVSPHSVKVPAPYCYRCFYRARYPGCGFLCVERIADFIEYSSSGSIACMIVEPVLGNGGNIVPPPGYFEALTRLLAEHDILLIADEVQTGMGRTGHLFASTAQGGRPNIITLAKGIGGIGIPAAAVLFEASLDVLESHEHSFTSGASPVALAAISATLEALSSGEILANVRENGVKLGALLRGLAEEHRCIGDVRGLGYMWGLEIVKADGTPDVDRTNAIVEAGLERHRLLVRSSRYGYGNVVKVRPPLIAGEEHLVEIVAKLSRAIADTGRGMP